MEEKHGIIQMRASIVSLKDNIDVQVLTEMPEEFMAGLPANQLLTLQLFVPSCPS